MNRKRSAPIKIERPLAFFDIEATGINTRADRIIELFITIFYPDNRCEDFEYLLNPGIPIPSEATAIHGFTDEDVKDKPSFAEKAHDIAEKLDGCDLAGYNLTRFDIPILCEEMIRAGLKTDLAERRVVDVQRIYHLKEPRDLSAALSFYCGEMHLNAHGARSDVDATIKVFAGQLARYKDMPGSIEELAAFCDTRKPEWVDRTGKLKWLNGEVVLGFGKRQGESLRAIIANDPGYIEWMLKSNFPRDTVDIILQARDGIWPKQV